MDVTESGIFQGDAYDLAPRLPAKSVDLLLTSPPYWGLRTYGLEHDDTILEKWARLRRPAAELPTYEWYREHGGQLGLEPYPEWYIQHLVELLNALQPALNPTASMWVNLGDTYFARWSSIRDNGRQGLSSGSRTRRRTPSGNYLRDKQLLLIPARFAIAMQAAGWVLRNDLIWRKSGVAPRPERDRLRLSHEHFFHFVLRPRNGRPAYFYDLDEAEPEGVDVVETRASAGGDGHSASFPADIVEPRIRSSSPVGGLVIDPFCGTGTTVTSAILAQRRGIGFELSIAHARTAQKQLAKAKRAVKAPT